MPSAESRRAMETPSHPPPAMMTLRVRVQRLPMRASTRRTDGRSETKKRVSPGVTRVSPDGALTSSSRYTPATRSFSSGRRLRSLIGLPAMGDRRSTSTPNTWTCPPANSSTSLAPGVAASAETARATSSSGLMTRSMLSELLSMMPFSPRYAGSWMRATRAMRSETVSAMRQATMLVSSLPVTATRMSAERRPAWSSTDGVLALPATAPTSMTSWARRSASSSWPTRTTS